MATIEEQLAVLSKAVNQLVLAKKQKQESQYPYFNERAADDVLNAVTIVLTHARPMIWPANGVALNTLYLRFRQGAAYLVQKVDAKFEEQLNLVQVTKIQKVGLRIAPRASTSTLALYFEDPTWKNDFEQFIDDSKPGDKFERIGIPLSDEDIAWIYEQLNPVKALFIYDEIENGKILVIRYDPK